MTYKLCRECINECLLKIDNWGNAIAIYDWDSKSWREWKNVSYCSAINLEPISEEDVMLELL